MAAASSRRRAPRRGAGAGIGLALSLWACGAALAERPLPPEPAGATWFAVSDRTLDRQRGGFDLGGGLVATFGIMRSVYINGELVTQTSLNLGQLSALTPEQAGRLGQQMAALNLVQNGPGNSVGANVGGSYGTVIQNTLNNQAIRSETVIDVGSNGMGLMRQLNAGTTLHDSLMRAAAPR